MNAEDYHAVVIGCGRGGENIGAHSIGYVHGKAYTDNPRIELAGRAISTLPIWIVFASTSPFRIRPEIARSFCGNFARSW
jgi:hypothetical protein